jgi:membrane protein HdeD
LGKKLIILVIEDGNVWGLFETFRRLIDMAAGNNVLLGILAIILGLMVIAFPLISVFTFSVLAGMGVLILGIWFLVQAFSVWENSKGVSIAYLILGIIAIIAGIGLVGNILALSFLASFILYLAGFFLFISGVITLFTGEGGSAKGVGVLGILIGIIYLILGLYAWDPFYLALLIGIWLIISGVFEIFKPQEEINTDAAE